MVAFFTNFSLQISIGVYLLASYGWSTYKNKDIWAELEKKNKELQNENERVRKLLQDTIWLAEVEQDVKSQVSKPSGTFIPELLADRLFPDEKIEDDEEEGATSLGSLSGIFSEGTSSKPTR